ncbi:hypothetical protein S40285_09547 [Stachybotrys chlorohalonatus IBT 40285]|uniref:Uncharacterized protein n=1 Tax=Stachybotrys chlorohalonatus (strain IBT 40285) TaxID=1283841 RepID=A0A084QSC1_STAC4|nr:hypothetical protein S40285_09547 [Stachybotrys chlorohalonata IBT 40285]
MEKINEKLGLFQEQQQEQPPPRYSLSENWSGTADTERGDVEPFISEPGSGLTKLPPAFSVYFNHKDLSEFTFGTSSSRIFCKVLTNWNKPDAAFSLVFHDGPMHEAPILATTGDVVMCHGQEATITLPNRSEITNAGQQGGELKARFEKAHWGNYHFVFRIVVPAPPDSKTPARQETFEWRSTRGDEIKNLDFDITSSKGKKASGADGWKLIRMAPQVSTSEAGLSGGKYKERDTSFTSNGKEIVALLGQARSWKLNNPLRFEFVGAGLTGVLGRDWEVVSVATGLLLFWTDGVLGVTSAPPGMSGLGAKKIK